jgi:protein-tyrosine phosphatase
VAALPPPEEPGRYRLAVVCLGNICRSPMAHVVLEHRLEQAGLADRVTVTSSGTGGWHTGHPMDERAAATLSAHGYDPSKHVARRFSTDWYAENDLLLAMDQSNRADMHDLKPTVDAAGRLMMFRAFDPEADDDAEVPDPYFGDGEGFELVLAMVERTADVLVDRLRATLEA